LGPSSRAVPARRSRKIYLNRAPSQQSYVSLAANIRNPEFPREWAYPAMATDFGLQILALFRFWNIIEYWFPWRDAITGKWEDVLEEFIPKMGLARSRRDYERAIIALVARINDGHAYIWASRASRPPEGNRMAPANIRFIGDQAVIAGLLTTASNFMRGDVITEIDGAPLSTLLDRWRPYYGASNEAARLRDIAINMTRGACGEASFRIRRGGEERAIAVRRANSRYSRSLDRLRRKPRAARTCFPEVVGYRRLHQDFISQSRERPGVYSRGGRRKRIDPRPEGRSIGADLAGTSETAPA
jgi:hypothetical protein